MDITVRIKNLYGIDRIYPADETANLLASLTGKKTFDERDISVIKRLGYTIKTEAVTL